MREQWKNGMVECCNGLALLLRLGVRGAGAALAEIFEDGQNGLSVLGRRFDVSPTACSLKKPIERRVAVTDHYVRDVATVEVQIQPLGLDLTFDGGDPIPGRR